LTALANVLTNIVISF